MDWTVDHLGRWFHIARDTRLVQAVNHGRVQGGKQHREFVSRRLFVLRRDGYRRLVEHRVLSKVYDDVTSARSLLRERRSSKTRASGRAFDRARKYLSPD